MIFTTLILILTVIISIYLLKELIPYLRYIIFYKSQGIKYHHTPLLGFVGAVHSPEKSDTLHKMKKLLNEDDKDCDIVAFNNHDNTQITFVLNNVELIKKFFAKELDHVKRKNFIEAPLSLGFFFQTGNKAIKRRAIFNDFFEGKNLEAIIPDIRKLVFKHIENLKTLYKNSKDLDKDGFLEYNFRDFTPDLFSDIVVQILFGDKEEPMIDGKRLPEMIEENMRKVMVLWKNPLNLLTGGLMEKIGSEMNEIKEEAEKIKEVVREVIRKRLNKKDEELGVTLVDLMVKFNRNCEKEDKMSIEDMVENVTLLQLAGQDTTKNSSEGLIKLISSKPEIINRILEEEIPKMFATEEDYKVLKNYGKSEFVDSVISESMRLIPPAAYSFPKVITKDLKLEKYTLKKNSLIFIPFIVYQYREQIFKNNEEFNHERFSGEEKKKIPRNAMMPFYSGRRACVGRYLAELIQRVILIEFLKAFEVKDNGKKIEKVIRFTYGVKESDIMIRLRK